MKVICEACGTSFLYNVVKDLQNCPVCGESLWDEDDNVDVGLNIDEPENGLMYFDEIITSCKDIPEYNGVCAYCGECGEFNFLELDKFKKLIDEEYVIIKDNIIITCRGCGKEHKSRKILYKQNDHYAPLLPRCPVCNSAMLKKITIGSKLLAAATIGAFALPYNSKTFECKDCGCRF